MRNNGIIRGMRAVRSLAIAVCLWPAFAFADSIDQLSPASFFVGSTEEFITARGTGLVGAEATMVEFSGPTGTEVLEPTAIVGSTVVTSWLPLRIGLTLGHYSMTILAIDSPTVTRRIGPAFFDVIAFPIAQPPLLGMPESVFGEAVSPNGAILTYTVTGKSFVDPAPPTIVCNPASGSLFPLGATTVACTATDSFGSTSGQFPAFVIDTVRPQLQLPANITTGDPVVTFTATAVDAIDGPLAVACTPPSGSTFAQGVTTVLCSATDANNNTATGTFKVTVVIEPVLTLPDDFSVEATGPDGAMVAYVATAEGGVITCTPPSGSTFPLGPTIVQCSATGPGGTTTGSFTVTVVDTTPPVISKINPSPSVLWPPNHAMIPVTFNVIATDTVSLNLASHIVSIESNQSVNGNGDGNTSPDWRITGALTAELRAERAGDIDRLYTITIVTVDESGNQATGIVQVRVANIRRRGV